MHKSVEAIFRWIKNRRKTISLPSRGILNPLICIGILSLLSTIVFRNLLFSPGWPGGGDALGWISRAYLYGKDLRWFYAWRTQSLGFVEIPNLLDFFLSIFYIVFQTPEVTVKAFMFSSFLLACFSSYVFAYKFSKRHVAALVASFVYSLNHLVISQLLEAHIEIMFGYALAPVIFLILDHALKKARLRDILILGLALSVVLTSFHAECIVIYGLLFGAYIIFFVVFPDKSERFHARFRKSFKTIIPVGLTVFLLSSIFLLPFLMNVRPYYFSSSYGYFLEEAQQYGYKNFLDAFTLRSTEAWGYTKYVDYSQGLTFPGFPTVVMTIVFLLSYSVLLIRRDRYTIFFALSTLVSSVIAMGPNSFLEPLFVWAWQNVPHFAVFRVMSRWIMIAALSHTFFIATFTAALLRFLGADCRKQKQFLFKVRMSSNSGEPKMLYASFDIFDKILSTLRRLLFWLGMFVLALVVITPILYGYFLIGQGLKTYTPPTSYTAPYTWLASEPGDYRIVTIGQNPADFADGSMPNYLGWGHEIGYDSAFIHDKPVLQNGGWEPVARSFVDYLRFQVVPNKLTDNLMRILGTFNFRYVVIPAYAGNEMREFFTRQKDVTVVYNNSESIILQNENYDHSLFGVTDSALIIGDMGAFLSLNKIDSFSLNRTALFFANQLDTSFLENPVFNTSRSLIIYNTKPIDTTMLTFKNEDFIVKLAQYGNNSYNNTKQWIPSPSWKQRGEFVFGDETLQTSGSNTAIIPFNAGDSDVYGLWIRVGFAPSRGALGITLDDITLKDIRPEAPYGERLSWVFLGNFSLEKGEHFLGLVNDGTGMNDVDAFAFIKPNMLKSHENEVLEAMKSFKGRIIELSDAAETSASESEDSSVEQIPFNGLVFRSDDRYMNIAPLSSASASSVFSDDYAYFDPRFAVDNSMQTRWASEPSKGMPQWLELDWPSKQKLTSIDLLFEDARAQDYAIQTWNGTDWIDQINVSGNQETVVHHIFPQEVETDKLRLYVTSAPKFQIASLWELQVYARKVEDFSVYAPRADYYRIALRAGSSSQGFLNLGLENLTQQIPLQGKDELEWVETSPVFLESGLHHMSIESGPYDLDQICMYSVQQNEDVSLTNLFYSGAPRPVVSYTRVDPCKYDIDIDTNDSIILVFSDSYHPLWRVYYENVELKPIITDYFANGFLIDKTGKFRVTLYFSGQEYTEIGSRIALITVTAVFVLLVSDSILKKLNGARLKRLRHPSFEKTTSTS